MAHDKDLSTLQDDWGIVIPREVTTDTSMPPLPQGLHLVEALRDLTGLEKIKVVLSWESSGWVATLNPLIGGSDRGPQGRPEDALRALYVDVRASIAAKAQERLESARVAHQKATAALREAQADVDLLKADSSSTLTCWTKRPEAPRDLPRGVRMLFGILEDLRSR